MSDHNAIIKTIEKYIEGGRLGDADVIKEAFADEATIYGSADGKPDGGPIQVLYDVVKKTGPAANLTGEIGVIDINHTTATVRVELYDWAGARYTDQMMLLKLGTEWKIINKVYHTHQ